ncbi:MAG TPA: SRPBCC domain-containing protein [Blastocatellia bacterium]|nr:SRPBCC domain-containing protein [Blastocatellia bacterium]
MTKEGQQPETRSIETRLEINASVDAVWKALTDAEEITQWFSLQAAVTPGAGGSVCWTWDELVEWKSRIEIWEPRSHLRLAYDRPATTESPSAQLAMDFYLEGQSGRSVLRLVHSGFGRGTDWDEEYDGVRRGWQYELRSMRHYLERHRGQKRNVVFLRRNFDFSEDEAWNRLSRLLGLQNLRETGELREGTRYDIATAAGDSFSGEVLVFSPPKEFCATIENLNNGLLRVAPEKCAGRNEVWVWFATYGVEQATLNDLRNRWEPRLNESF